MVPLYVWLVNLPVTLTDTKKGVKAFIEFEKGLLRLMNDGNWRVM